MDIDIYTMEYVKAVVILIASIFCIKAIFSKKLIIDPKKLYSNEIKKEYVRKHVKMFNIIARIIMTIIVIGAILYIIIPAIKDCENYISGDFKTIRCVTTSKSNDRETFLINRTIQLINIDTKEKLELTINYTSIEVGEYYTIEYLPNIKVGKIISKNK